MMEKNAKIYVAGHRGMVGSAIVRELERLVLGALAGLAPGLLLGAQVLGGRHFLSSSSLFLASV